MSEYHIGDLSIVGATPSPYGAIGSALIGLGIVVSTLISRCCRHEWENVGEARKVVIEYDAFPDSMTFRQTVRCVKCGKNSWQEVG